MLPDELSVLQLFATVYSRLRTLRWSTRLVESVRVSMLRRAQCKMCFSAFEADDQSVALLVNQRGLPTTGTRFTLIRGSAQNGRLNYDPPL